MGTNGVLELEEDEVRTSSKKEKRAPAPKAANLTALKAGLNKKYGDGTIMHGPGCAVKVDSWPSGIPTLDALFGCGGVPKGRIIEIFGLESSGKTTVCLTLAASCQATDFVGRKGQVAFIDAEHALDPTWATHLGVNMDDLLFNQPSSGEEALQIAADMAESGLVDLIIVDSVAALVPKAELEGDMEDNIIGGQARMMSKAMRKLTAACSNTGCVIIFINQIREKIGVLFGSPETTPGGKALKFFASLRMEIRAGKPIDENKVRMGKETSIKLIKNKVGTPFRKTSFNLMYGIGGYPHGVDRAGNLITAAVEAGVIAKSSSYYSFGDIRVNGLEKFIIAVKDNMDLFNQISREFQAKVKSEVVIPLGDLEDEDLAEALEDAE